MNVGLWLVLAQVSFVPFAGPVGFPSQGTWSPPPLGRVSAAYDDGGWAVAWADQRRFPVASSTFSDVWVVTPAPDGGLARYAVNSLSSNAARDNAVIATNGAAWLVGWSENDGGFWLRARSTVDTNFDTGWLAEATLASPAEFQHGSDLVAGSNGQWRLAWRKGGSIWVQYSSTLGSAVTTAPNLVDSSLVGLTNGDFVLAWLVPNTLFSRSLATMSGVDLTTSQPLPLHLSTSAQVPQLIHQDDAGAVSFFQHSSGAILPLGPSLSGTNTAVPLLSTALRSGTLVTYRDANGAQMRVVTDVSTGIATNFSPAGVPVALASEPTLQRAVLVEQDGGSVFSRPITMPTTQTFIGPFRPLNVLPSPQLRPTVAWSDTKQAFLVMWDEFVPPSSGKAMYAYLALDGGVTDPQPLGGVVDGGTRPRLLQGPPGQQLGLLTYNLSQFFETLNEVNGTVSVGSAIGVPANVTYATRGARTLAWGPRGGSVELFTDWGSAVTSFLQPMPRCAALKGGQFWFGPISGTVQWTMGETAGVPAFATGGAAFSGQGQHCYAVRPIHDTVVVGYNAVDGGQRLMTVEPPFVDLVAPQPGTGSPLVTPLGSSLLVSWVEPPRVKGFVLAFDGGVTPITIDDKAVDGREHWAASSPNGAAAIVWQAFDVASGRVLVNARIVVEPTAPSTTVDGGFDAGVASPDAGPGDAGSKGPDAGSTLPDAGPPPPDAGPADSGTGDAGEGDAGVRDGGVDAGAGDAGSPPDGGTPDAGPDAGAASVDGGGFDAGPGDGSTFVPVCGCTGSSGAPVLLLAVMLLRRRRHPTR